MVADRDEAGNISDDLVVTKYKMAAEITNSKLNYEVQKSLGYGFLKAGWVGSNKGVCCFLSDELSKSKIKYR